MKKTIFVLVFVLMFLGIGQVQAATIYVWNVTVDDTGLTNKNQLIAGVDFKISGAQGTDWEFVGFNSVYDGIWMFFKTGINDDKSAPPDTDTYTPLMTGPVFQLRWLGAGIPTIDTLEPYNYDAGDFAGKFSAELTAVPIPPAILLLGGGLLSLVALRRRRS